MSIEDKEKDTEAYLEQLKDIRTMMERSSRFISLSGLSGIITGIIALVGAAVAWWYVHFTLLPQVGHVSISAQKVIESKFLIFLFADASLVLIGALCSGIFFSMRKSARQNLLAWNKMAELTIVNLLIPLAAGGIFCLIVLLQYHYYLLVAPITLIFYGLALLNASKYTLKEVRYLGICEIILGLIACLLPTYALYFWAIGFGILHIIYGSVMYYRYER